MKFSKKLKKLIAFLLTWLIVASGVVYLETNDQTSGLKHRLDDFENVLFDFLSVAKLSTEAQLDPHSDSQQDTASVTREVTKEPRIVLVDIDEASMEQLGNYNLWPRSHHAKVVEQLGLGGAASITFDILFKTADWGLNDTEAALKVLKQVQPESNWDSLKTQLQSGFNYDSMLVQSVQGAERVISSATVGQRDEYFNEESHWRPKADPDWIRSNSPNSGFKIPEDLPLPPKIQMEVLDNTFSEFSNAAYKMGLVNVNPDLDGVHRSEPLFYALPDTAVTPGLQPQLYPVIALQTALLLMGLEPHQLKIIPQKEVQLGQPFGLYQDSTGFIQTTYPLLPWTAIKRLIQSKDTIQSIHRGTSNRKVDLSSTLRIHTEDEQLIASILHAQVLSSNMYQGILNTPGFFKVARDIQAAGDSILQQDPKPQPDAPGAIQVAAIHDQLLIGYHLEERKVALYDFDGVNIYDDEWIYLDEYTLDAFEHYLPQIRQVQVGENRYFSIPLEVKKHRGKLKSSIIVLQDDVILDLISQDIQDLETRLAQGDTIRFGDPINIPIWGVDNRMMINFLGLEQSKDNKIFDRISYYDLIHGRVDIGSFQGKVFMLGSTAPALFDMVAAPGVGNFPGVDIHLNMLQNILTNNFLRKVDQSTIIWIIILFAFLATFMATYLSPIWASILLGAISIAYFIFNFQYFHYGQYYGIVKPQLALILGFGFTLIYKFIFEEREKRQAVEAFKNYISPELIDQMLESEERPTLGGEERYLTAYFTDIASFSTFSEKIGSPTRLVELLNEYLTEMTDILTDSGGTLDKYEGDAIIAFFGAPVALPNNAYSACYSAILMQHKLDKLREKWRSEGTKWPVIVHQMRMRIGLNSGQIVTGNMGSKMRMNYTMMGDAVNLAARLESGAKQYGVFTMCSKETLESAIDQSHMDITPEDSQALTNTQSTLPREELLYRPIDKVRVVGKSEPVEIFELLNFKSQASPSELELIELFSLALEQYRLCQWDLAEATFTQCLVLEPHHPDRAPGCKTTPSHVFIERCQQYRISPPVAVGQAWDGVYTATEK